MKNISWAYRRASARAIADRFAVKLDVETDKSAFSWKRQDAARCSVDNAGLADVSCIIVSKIILMATLEDRR